MATPKKSSGLRRPKPTAKEGVPDAPSPTTVSGAASFPADAGRSSCGGDDADAAVPGQTRSSLAGNKVTQPAV